MKLQRTLILCLTLVLGLTQAAVAGICYLHDTAWAGIAEGFGPWTLTAQAGPTPGSGSLDIEFFDADWTLFGTFPTAVSGSLAQGTWERTGISSFAVTFLAYGFDDTGAVVYISRTTLAVQLLEDCAEADLLASLDIYAPGQNPLGDEVPAFACGFPYPLPITGKRIEVGGAFCGE